MRREGGARARARRLAGEHVQVRAFVLIEQQGAGAEAGTWVGRSAMFQPDVVTTET
jgi:hypothetical protein